MQNTDDYKDKYLKYKHKYLQLAGALNQQHMVGGDKHFIIGVTCKDNNVCTVNDNEVCKNKNSTKLDCKDFHLTKKLEPDQKQLFDAINDIVSNYDDTITNSLKIGNQQIDQQIDQQITQLTTEIRDIGKQIKQLKLDAHQNPGVRDIDKEHELIAQQQEKFKEKELLSHKKEQLLRNEKQLIKSTNISSTKSDIKNTITTIYKLDTLVIETKTYTNITFTTIRNRDKGGRNIVNEYELKYTHNNTPVELHYNPYA